MMDEQDLPPTRRDVTPERGPGDASHPLRGVVLCCTSIPPEKRAELTSQAEQMGALHRFDLTSETTHLIVGEYDTPKYRFVAQWRTDIKVLTPRWIEAVRQLWIEDQAIDVAETEKEHALPTFASLRICLTGFENQGHRQSMIDLITANGGEYHGDLTRNVTHLVANRPEGQKYDHAKIWRLRVVSEEWLQDSLERGMILDETLFNPEWPAEERGKNAWNRRKRASLGKRSFDQGTAGPDNGKRKLRRTASTKLTSENEKIWGDIVSGGGTVQAAYSGIWETSSEEALKHQMTTKITQQPQPLESNPQPYQLPLKGTFSGCRFHIHGFVAKKSGVLEKHLVSHMAQISTSLDDLVSSEGVVGYVVVPNDLAAPDVPTIPPSSRTINIVTDWWVERCIEAKSVVNPAEYPLGRPFPTFPLPRFSELKICSTGFEGLQLLHLTKATKLMGAKYEEMFSKDASVLICNPNRSVRKEKITFAQEWKLPVVSLDWLIHSIQKGERQFFKTYVQRQKKAKAETITKTSAMDDSYEKEGQEPEDIKPDAIKRRPTQDSRPCGASNLDPTAFADEPSVKVEYEEDESFRTAPSTTTTPPTEPLNEISANSPRKLSSPSKALHFMPRPGTAMAPRLLPAIEPTTNAISTAITSLLANAKPIAATTTAANDTTTTAAHSSVDEPADTTTQQPTRKKRAPTRILGRVASNLSTTSNPTPLTRASSVDSTASTGIAVHWPAAHNTTATTGSNPNPKSTSTSTSTSPHHGRSNTTASTSSLTKLTADIETDHPAAAAPFRESDGVAGGGVVGGAADDDTQPQTQMQYEDPESSDYKARVLARVRGEKVVERKERARVATIASLDQGVGGVESEGVSGRGVRRGGRLRERNNGGGCLR